MPDDVLTYYDDEPFPGRIGLTFDESVPAWPQARRAPEGAPNVVLVVLDDVGFAQLGCFGSDIATPNLDALATDGLRYRNFHTTAMCSPTRACLLTGRNHHTCAIGGITDLALGFPGYHGRIPKSCGFVPEVLRQRGWATFAVGKWHLAPSDETHTAAPRDRWPLGQGFERYYGFIGAETNQYFPELVVDNTPIRFEPPAGYHLTEDLVDKSIDAVNDLRGTDAAKPFFLYLALGACHAPHQAPREWIDRYAGQFDDGWQSFRERAHARQLAEGIVPPGTDLAPQPPWVPDWDSLSDDERRAGARMMEVFAGFLSHTDHHLGRLFDFLRATDELDKTLVLVLSDNGASAEGGPNGTFNENFIFSGLPHDAARTMELIDELGGPNSYGHYPWGWALAGNTPFQRWKRETHEGGIGDPLIVRAPHTDDRGAIRHQYTHAIDIAATILDYTGVAMPDMLDGHHQEPVAGASFLASVAEADAPEHRPTQYYEQFACRAIYHEGWKAVSFHPFFPYMPGEDANSPHSEDKWELYNLAEDASECHDLAAEMPEKLRALQDRWFEEAGRYGALPLKAGRGMAVGRPHALGERHRVALRQGATAIPEPLAPNTKLRRHQVIVAADVVPDGDGVLVAQGGRFGGFSLHVVDGCLEFAYNFAGVETRSVRSGPLAPGRHVLGVDVVPSRDDGPTAMRAALVVDGTVGEPVLVSRTTPLRFTLHGEGLTCGYTDGTPVTEAYAAPFTYPATIHDAFVDTSGEEVIDVYAEIQRAWTIQ